MTNEIFFNGNYLALVNLTKKELKAVTAFKLSNIVDSLKDYAKNYETAKDAIIVRYGTQDAEKKNFYTFTEDNGKIANEEIADLNAQEIPEITKVDVKLDTLPDLSASDISLLKVFINFVE